jgi:hypothetical protein
VALGGGVASAGTLNGAAPALAAGGAGVVTRKAAVDGAGLADEAAIGAAGADGGSREVARNGSAGGADSDAVVLAGQRDPHVGGVTMAAGPRGDGLGGGWKHDGSRQRAKRQTGASGPTGA